MSLRTILPSTERKNRRDIACALVVIALVGICFGKTIGFDFVLFDDNVHLADNPFLKSLAWKPFLELWKHSYFGMYIPVTYSFWFAVARGQELVGTPAFSPAAFHGLNFGLHVLNALLVMGLAKNLG